MGRNRYDEIKDAVEEDLSAALKLGDNLPAQVRHKTGRLTAKKRQRKFRCFFFATRICINL